jgi:putative hemolysin
MIGLRMPIYVEIIIILVLLLVNGFFALSELAIVSARKGRLQHLANEGNRRAQLALTLANAPAELLSSVQVGLTLVSIVVGAFGSEALARPLTAVLIRWLPHHLAIIASYIIVIGVITYFTVLIGELVPKRIALSNPERLAMRVAPAMSFISRLATPLVLLLSGSSNLVVRLLRLPPPETQVSDEEVSMLFEEGISAGVFEEEEKEIVDRLFRLSDRRVNSIMTPRVDVFWLDIAASREEIVRTIAEHPHTAYPVCRENLDHIEGVVLLGDMALCLLHEQPLVLRNLMRPPLVLYEGFRALQAIERLKEAGMRLAIVVNEYGGTEGIFTPTDIVESLVGELPSLEAPAVMRRPDGSLLVDGLLPIDELKELLDVRELPHEDEDYQTLAGLLLTNLGRIPHTGDRFTWDSFCFEVVDMDGTRVDKVLINPLPDASE